MGAFPHVLGAIIGIRTRGDGALQEKSSFREVASFVVLPTLLLTLVGTLPLPLLWFLRPLPCGALS